MTSYHCVRCGGVGSAPTHAPGCPLAASVGRHQAGVSEMLPPDAGREAARITGRLAGWPAGPVSVFDEPDAGREAARVTGRALLETYREWNHRPGGATGAEADEWIGRAAAVLEELSR